MSGYPKVLLINGTAIGAKNGTGVSLNNMFADWPKDKLLQVVPEAYKQSDNSSKSDFNVIFLPKESVPYEYFFRGLFRLVYKKNIWSEVSGEKAENIIQKVSLKNILKAWIDTSPVILNKQILKQINEFKPDVIYTMLGSIKISKMVYKISKETQVNVVLHFMDDWIESFYNQTKLTFYPRMVLYSLFQKLLAKTNHNLAISDAMAEEYQRRYSKPFTAIMNSVPSVQDVKQLTGDKIKLIYMGGLHLKRWQSLSVIANELKEYNNIIMEIYAPERDKKRYREQIENQNVTFLPPVKPDQVLDVIEKADITVFCESFEMDVRFYIAYSLSTKIPEYMASGRPILCYAPKEIASSKYIDQSGSGLVADTPQGLKKALDKLVNDQEVRRICGQNGIETARKNHLQNQAHKKLIEVLSQ